MKNRVYKHETGHAISEGALHDDGIYGEIGFQLNTKDALALGCAMGTMLKSKNQVLVIIGQDNRASSEVLESEFCRGLAATGCYVMRAGVAPSPAVQFSAHCLNASTVMISGSSRSCKFNGFYLCIQQSPLSGERLQRLAALATNGSWSRARGGVVDSSILDAYLKKLRSSLKNNNPPIKIAWDLCGGTACNVITELSDHISGEHLLMNDELDPFFGELNPDSFAPERLQTLQDVIKEENCSIGFIINADSRQLSVSDDMGVLWQPAEIFYLLLGSAPKNENNPAVVVVGVNCPVFVCNRIKELGYNLIFAGSNISSILERMNNANALLGFSCDGYFAFGKEYDYEIFDDAIFTAITIINIISAQGLPLSSLRAQITRDVTQPKRYFEHEDPETFLQAVRRRLIQQGRNMFDLYGIRHDFEKAYWHLHLEGKHLVLEVSASNKANLDIANRDVEQLIRLVTSEVKKLEEITEDNAKGIEPSEQLPTRQKQGLKNISDVDREAIDFTSRHWRSIRKPKRSVETKEKSRPKRPWQKTD